MPHISPLPRSKFSPYVRVVDLVVRKMAGDSIEPLGIYARVPGLVRAQTGMERVFMSRRRATSDRLLELVALRAAIDIGCGFCLDFGSYLATTKHGITPEEVRGLVEHHESGLFAADELAALDFTVAMTATPPTINDGLIARMREHFTEQQIVELTAMVAWENSRARGNAALGVESHGFSKADACAIPSASAAEQHAAQHA